MRIKLIALLFVCAVVSANAQDIEIGIRGGVNFDNSNIEYNGLDADTRVGFHVGAVSQFNIISDGWKLNAGLIFSQSEFTLKQDNKDNTGITYHFKTNNLEIPLHIRKEFKVLNVKPFVQAGPYFSYTLSGKIKDGTGSHSIKFNKNADRFDIGANMGVGCNIMAGLQLMANYGYGFTEAK